MFLMILAVVVVLIVLWAIGGYNGLVKLKTMVDEAWSGVDVQLKRRHDLIPNLVNTTKGLAGHEKELMQKVTEARSARGMAQAVKAENEISHLLTNLIATAEAYPEIKADSSFNKLSSELSGIEEQLSMARRYYNGTVREYNTTIAQFPRLILARLFAFLPRDFFELDNETERQVPIVDFSK